MPDFEDLVTQLSGVREGQRDKGRTKNISSHPHRSAIGKKVGHDALYI